MALSAVIAPEPAAWLAPLLRRLGPDTLVLAPWALPRAPAWIAPLVQGAGPLPRLWAALRRRTLPDQEGPRLTWLPGWVAVEAAARLWSRGRTDRQMTARFALRALVDRAAAAWLPAGVSALYAPSCAAQRSFAVARARGLATALVHDLPLLRRLHEDLDQAARVHPQAAFLRRFRASPAALRRQEREYVLADQVLVRGGFAEGLLRERGLRVDLLPGPPPTPAAPPVPPAAVRDRPRTRWAH